MRNKNLFGVDYENWWTQNSFFYVTVNTERFLHMDETDDFFKFLLRQCR